ncbi:MAG TPA: hypothetical protein VNY75_05270 [Rhizomicrobium sp.]|nr:hypothetical protein [Rhizomicrobium sp.]
MGCQQWDAVGFPDIRQEFPDIESPGSLLLSTERSPEMPGIAVFCRIRGQFSAHFSDFSLYLPWKFPETSGARLPAPPFFSFERGGFGAPGNVFGISGV